MMLEGQFKEQRKHWLLIAAVFFCFLGLYAFTAQRGVSWQDSGEFQYRVAAGDFVWHSGVARAHPLYIGMASAFAECFRPGRLFYAVNLFSGVGLAAALTLLAATVWRLTGSRGGACVAVLALGLAHMAWWLATVAEVYTWSLAGLMGELYCLVRFVERRQPGWLLALFFVNGAHAAIHNFAFLSLPVYAALFLDEERRLAGEQGRSLWRSWGSGLIGVGCVAGAWLGGAWLLVGLVLAEWATGGSLVAALKSLLFGHGYETLVLGQSRPDWRLVAANLAFAGVSLLSPCWLFVRYGWRGASRAGAVRACLLALTAVHGLFWLRYFAPDQATFVLPTLGLLAVWAGLGYAASGVSPKAGAAFMLAGALCAVGVPSVLSEIGHRAGARVSRARQLPFRDEVGYWLLPWKQREDSAARFVAEVSRQLRAGDVLVADSTAAAPLLAAREAGTVKADWRLVTPWSGEAEEDVRQMLAGAKKRRVYLVSPVAGYAPRAVLEGARGFVREGVLYRASPGDESSGRPDRPSAAPGGS